jgi:hypothetical protein
VRNIIIFVFMLAVGLGLGLYIGWVAAPRPFSGAVPASLNQSAKDEQVVMIATAYARDQNLALARQRMITLGFADPGPAIVETAQRRRAAQAVEAEMRCLAQLAAAFNTFSPILQPYQP